MRSQPILLLVRDFMHTMRQPEFDVMLLCTDAENDSAAALPGLGSVGTLCCIGTCVTRTTLLILVAEVLFSLLSKCSFKPLLESCLFLLVRLHSGNAEADVTVQRACLLQSTAEFELAKTIHTILQVSIGGFVMKWGGML